MKYTDLQPGKIYRMYLTRNEFAYRVNGKIFKYQTDAAFEIYKMEREINWETATDKEKQAKVTISKIKSKYDSYGKTGQVLGTHKVQGHKVEILVMPAEYPATLAYWKTDGNGNYFRSEWIRGEYEEANRIMDNFHTRTEQGIYNDYKMQFVANQNEI